MKEKMSSICFVLILLVKHWMSVLNSSLSKKAISFSKSFLQIYLNSQFMVLFSLASLTNHFSSMAGLKTASSGWSRAAETASWNVLQCILTKRFLSASYFYLSNSCNSAIVFLSPLLAGFLTPNRSWLLPKPMEDLGRGFLPILVTSRGGLMRDSGISWRNCGLSTILLGLPSISQSRAGLLG